jgi:kynurenine 3-monooxygenase
MNEQKHCIIGAGLVGSLLSVIMAQRGFHVDVYERRTDMRKAGAEGGRSINLALSNRGFRALELIGLADEVRKLCIPMHGRMVHDESGNTRFMAYGKAGQYINSVSRGGLNEMLLRKADEHDRVSLHFNERCDDVHYAGGRVHFHNTETKKDTTEKYDVIFGTDGAFSAARLGLMKSDRFDFHYTQDYLEYGYKELTIPAGKDNPWQIEKNALHIWPRGRFMMIALPNLDGSFTCTLFLDFEGAVSFSKLNTKEDVSAFFNKYFPDAVPLMPDLLDDFFENPTSSLVTIRCTPWNYHGKGLLLGDAAHAIVPFYGQGMNAGFEDCTILNAMIETYGPDWNRIFPEFSRKRKPDGDAVAELALRNFIEMRDLVADPAFILRNKIDKKLGEYFPDKWLPLYTMVTFSDMPYAQATRLGKEHDEILENIVLEIPDIESMIDKGTAKEALESFVSQGTEMYLD